MNPKNPKILSDLLNKLLNDVPIHFLSGMKICKMGTTVTQGLHTFNTWFFTQNFSGKDEGIIGHI